MVYAWKANLMTGGKLTRIGMHLGLKYRLGWSYTMDTITAQIGHTWRFMNSRRLAQYRITLTKFID